MNMSSFKGTKTPKTTSIDSKPTEPLSLRKTRTSYEPIHPKFNYNFNNRIQETLAIDNSSYFLNTENLLFPRRVFYIKKLIIRAQQQFVME